MAEAQAETPAERAPPLEINSVTVDVTPDDESVTYNGERVRVTARGALVAATLAAAMPNPVDRDFIAKRVWHGERKPEFAGQMVGVEAAKLVDLLKPIGLDVFVARGVGIGMRPAE